MVVETRGQKRRHEVKPAAEDQSPDRYPHTRAGLARRKLRALIDRLPIDNSPLDFTFMSSEDLSSVLQAGMERFPSSVAYDNCPTTPPRVPSAGGAIFDEMLPEDPEVSSPDPDEWMVLSPPLREAS